MSEIVVPPSATPKEAAAIVAAIRRFRDDHAPVIAADGPRLTPWQQAALLEGTRREPELPSAGGDSALWGS